MSGISKHYILHMKDDVKHFDKRIIPEIQRIVTWKVTNSIPASARAEIESLLEGVINQEVPWRKKLLGLWEISKKVGKSKSPWGWKLTEYGVRRGRGTRRLDAFKNLARHYRAFRVPCSKPTKPVTSRIRPLDQFIMDMETAIPPRATGVGAPIVTNLPPRETRNRNGGLTFGYRLEPAPVQQGAPMMNLNLPTRWVTADPVPAPTVDDWFDPEIETQARRDNNF